MEKLVVLALTLLLTIGAANCQAVAGAPSASPAPTTDKQTDQQSVLDQLPPEVASQPAFQLRTPRYQLRANDTLEISFTMTPELDQVVMVQPDGYVTLKQIGDMHVAGRTVPEFRTQLATAYQKILNDPVVTVVLKDFEKPYFTAGGELGKPGKYDMSGDTTLTEAIAIAGGFRDTARHSEVLLFRRASRDWVEVKKIDVGKGLKAGTQEYVYLRPGDMIYVPKSRLAKVKSFLPSSSVGLRPF
jgi:polysaccharide biosynthesis/export protein